MSEPTRDDARLYVQLLEITQAGVQVEARRWVFSEFDAAGYKELQSKYPPGSLERDRLFNVLGFFESAAVLVSRGLLHEDVFFDAPFGLEMLWAKVGPILVEWQKAANDPAVWENVVWLGQRYEIWKQRRWKAKLEAMPPEQGPLKAEPSIRGFTHD